MKNITVAGGGVLGSQIAFQIAYCGYNVTIWLRSEKSIEKTKKSIDELQGTYLKTIKTMKENDWCMGISNYDEFDKVECEHKAIEAINNIKYEIDMNEAFSKADLVIESIIEDINEKKSFYSNISNILKENALLVTNSSSLLPSKMAKSTGRPDRYLAMHFANNIWKNNVVEVMAHADTDPKNFDKIIKFASEINMVPLPVKKEKNGYLLNSMLIPLLFSALDLYVNGISDPESIDKAWVTGTGAPKGPFQILDTVGLNTAYNIVKTYLKIPSFMAPYNFKGIAKLLEKYIAEGKLGKSTKEGFYMYK